MYTYLYTTVSNNLRITAFLPNKDHHKITDGMIHFIRSNIFMYPFLENTYISSYIIKKSRLQENATTHLMFTMIDYGSLFLFCIMYNNE